MYSSTPLRYYLATFCAMFMSAVAHVNASERQRVSDFAIRKLPITLAVAEVGDFGAPQRSWYLSVNSAGQAQLAIGRTTYTYRTSVVSREQLDELRNVLIRERFFDLEEHYGECVASGGCRLLSVTVGEYSRTVKLDNLMNWVYRDQAARLRDPARALRVWMVIRGWFSDADAVDTREYDKMLLDAAAKAEKETH